MPKTIYPQLSEGDYYNNLLVKEIYTRPPAEGSKKRYGRKRFILECYCGKEFDSDASNIMNGHTKSCGCIYKTVTGQPKEKHGMSYTPTWSSWRSMLQRCSNPTEREKLYYDGIGYSEEWLLFENFFRDMGERPDGTSLDRINPNLGYCKDNCRWANRTLQAYNQRMSSRNTSGCTGVYWSKVAGKWCAYISQGKKRVYTGYFNNFEDAVRVRKEKEVEFYGFNV